MEQEDEKIKLEKDNSVECDWVGGGGVNDLWYTDRKGKGQFIDIQWRKQGRQ